MSSACCMYKLQPVITNDAVKLQTTHNMYKLRSINGDIDNTPLVSLQTVIDGRVEEILKENMGNLSLLESRQDEILKKLSELKLNMKNLREELNGKTVSSAKTIPQSIRSGGCIRVKENCQPCQELEGVNDIVICASPQFPPYSLLGLVRAWGLSCSLELQSYTHSTVASIPEVAKLFSAPVTGKPSLKITVVWKDVGPNPEMIVSPLKHVTICGETNILRFLSRVGPPRLSYENSDLVNITKVDELLDMCETLVSTGNNKEKQSVIKSLNASLDKGQWMCGKEELSIADVAVWSAFKQVINTKEIPQSMVNWFDRCNSALGNTQE